MATVFVEVRFLKDFPSVIGSDLNVYGPFTAGKVYALPKTNAAIFIRSKIAVATREEAKKPTLKEMFKGEVLTPYIEAALTKPLFPEEATNIQSDFMHDELIKSGWKPTIPIPRLEEALKQPGRGGSSTAELALEKAQREYDPKVYELKVTKHYALHGDFPYTVFVRERKPTEEDLMDYVVEALIMLGLPDEEIDPESRRIVQEALRQPNPKEYVVKEVKRLEEREIAKLEEEQKPDVKQMKETLQQRLKRVKQEVTREKET